MAVNACFDDGTTTAACDRTAARPGVRPGVCPLPAVAWPEDAREPADAASSSPAAWSEELDELDDEAVATSTMRCNVKDAGRNTSGSSDLFSRHKHIFSHVRATKKVVHFSQTRNNKPATETSTIETDASL
jgi:hypothetical protein